MITYNKKTKTLFEWAKEKGISPQTLWARINKQKWSIEKSLITKVNGDSKVEAS